MTDWNFADPFSFGDWDGDFLCLVLIFQTYTETFDFLSQTLRLRLRFQRTGLKPRYRDWYSLSLVSFSKHRGLLTSALHVIFYFPSSFNSCFLSRYHIWIIYWYAWLPCFYFAASDFKKKPLHLHLIWTIFISIFTNFFNHQKSEDNNNLYSCCSIESRYKERRLWNQKLEFLENSHFWKIYRPQRVKRTRSINNNVKANWFGLIDLLL